MQSINILTAKISELRAFVADHNIEVLGNKSLKASFITAIELFQSTAAIVKAEAIELKEFYTSPEAIEVYTEVLKFSRQSVIVFGTLLVAFILLTVKALQWTQEAGRLSRLYFTAAWNTHTVKTARRGVKRRLKDWIGSLNELGEGVYDRVSLEFSAVAIFVGGSGDWIK